MTSLDEDGTLAQSLPRYTHWLVIITGAVLMNNLVWYAMSQDVDYRDVVARDPTVQLGFRELRFDVEGITKPSLCRPGDVVLADNEKVIGVVVDDEARAYVVRAFELAVIRDPKQCGAHLVADSVAGQPLWVTHCDRTHSTRVFTSAPEDTTPNVRVGGWKDGLVLMVGGKRFMQNDRSLPLTDAEYTVTSWQKWLKRHPKTLVYTGDKCS